MIAVGLGPGSYTGIRAAIAMAQGWQLARGVKLLGVSSAEALAAQAQAENIFGRVNLVIDAQRGEFYLATWEISGGAAGRNFAAENRAGGGDCRAPAGGRDLRRAGGGADFVSGRGGGRAAGGGPA